MSPDAAVAARAAELLSELLTADRDKDPEVGAAAITRVYAEMAAHPALGLTMLVLLLRIASLTAAEWCREDAGDWAATVTRLRARMLS